jgi:hypothetical protein
MMWHESYPMSSCVRAEPHSHPPLPTQRFPTADYFYRPGTILRLDAYDSPLEKSVELTVRSHISVGFGEFWQQVVCDVRGDPLKGYDECEALLFDPLYLDIFDIPYRESIDILQIE